MASEYQAVSLTESKGYNVHWTDSRTVGVECDLIFEDCPTDNGIILLPNPFISKDHPHLPKLTQPPTNPSKPKQETTSNPKPIFNPLPEPTKAKTVELPNTPIQPEPELPV